MGDFIRVRPEGPADVPAIRTVLAEAFTTGTGTEPSAGAGGAGAGGVGVVPEVALVDALRDGPAWLPELSMVLEVDGVVVAYALLSRVWVGESGADALALGPVGVRPSDQGRGFGTDVVRAALDSAVELGERLVLVLGEPAFYGRFGFEPASAYGLTSPWSGPHYMALGLTTAVSGPPPPIPQGEVHYPPPWREF